MSKSKTAPRPKVSTKVGIPKAIVRAVRPSTKFVSSDVITVRDAGEKDTDPSVVVADAYSNAHEASPPASKEAAASPTKHKVRLLPVIAEKEAAGIDFPLAAEKRFPVSLEYVWPPVAPWIHVSVDDGQFGSYQSEAGNLSLAFTIIAFSRLGEITRLELRFDGLAPIALGFWREKSPRLGEAHPEQLWAAMARHVIEDVSKPQLQPGSTGTLVAIIGDSEVPLVSVSIGWD